MVFSFTSEDLFSNGIPKVPVELQESLQSEMSLLKILIKANSLRHRVTEIGNSDFTLASGLLEDSPDLRFIIYNSLTNMSGNEQIRAIKFFDAINLYGRDHSHVAYTARNLLGSLREEERKDVIHIAVQAASPGGDIANFIFRRDERTTETLAAYLAGQNKKVLYSCRDIIITDKGFIEIPSPEEIKRLYKEFGVQDIYTKDVGPLMIAVLGRKRDSK